MVASVAFTVLRSDTTAWDASSGRDCRRECQWADLLHCEGWPDKQFAVAIFGINPRSTPILLWQLSRAKIRLDHTVRGQHGNALPR